MTTPTSLGPLPFFPSFAGGVGWAYRIGVPAAATDFPTRPPPPPSRSRALLFLVLGDVTPSWSSFTRNCLLWRSLAGFRTATADGVATPPAEEEEEEDTDGADSRRPPREVPVAAPTGRVPPEFPPAPAKVA